MAKPSSVFKHSARTLTQPAPDGRILLHLDSGQYFALDDVSDRVWELTDGQRTVAEIAQAICAEYDAPLEMVQADVSELLADLQEAELVIEVTTG